MIKKLWQKFVVWRYIEAGLNWGDCSSYSHLGATEEYDRMYNKLLFWEKRYKKLGYKPLDYSDWDLTGWGKPYKDKLYIKDTI